MKTLLIVHHTMTGGTAQMVEAAVCAARSEGGVELALRRAFEATAADVLGADGYLFATPENLAAMSGALKDFFDRTYYAALDRINGRPYAVMVCAGTDGSMAVRQIERIATGWRLRAVAEPLIVRTGAQTPEDILAPKRIDEAALRRCAELGQALAAGLASGVF
ncbi:flavodoxin [Variovorax paradoxus]|uniref:flavodoxin family protein n=1 Tax=Comamonadaceae TaxID=80864 RepID=UPI000570638C|nr:NAD(P)H-dependent oxidoreductase [Xenophilus azovorans]KPU99525.1 flavodoxin [Variovorax paradoxus]MBN8747241.1 NAD(P)H-dependent oxidoreductase [Variovorax sp.]VTY39573.1 Flavodoxin [Xylophilus ampelinus]KPV07550.1 flavodoxin [Variovorax paradoxus]KPV07799.1 flavodoxin [Variovorax paradoxus]